MNPTKQALQSWVCGCAALLFCVVAVAQSREFDLPSGDMKTALDAFVRQSGLQLIYRTDDVMGLSAKGLKVVAPAEQALAQLLEGTPLAVGRDSTQALVVYRRITFHVPAQSIGSALIAFAAQSGLIIGSPPDATSLYRTEPLDGLFEARDALRRLLAGSGLEIASDDGGRVVLRNVAGDAARLDAVTVTAQRRPEEAQSVPIAITTFSAQAIETYGMKNLKDVSELTPGLLVSAFSRNNPTIAIRGTSNTFSQIGVSKPVAVVVDDVFIPRNSAASFDLFDLDSIAVLKGPQGTLFGRNVTGGAIVITTRAPSFAGLKVESRITAGNYGDKQFDGLVNVPLTDDAAFKFSTSLQKRNGFGRDRLTGNAEDDTNSQNYRSHLRLQPSSDVDVLLSADFSRDTDGGRTLSSNTLGDDGDRRTSELGVKQHFGRTIRGVSAKAVWQAGIGELTSITAYRNSESGEDYSGVGASYRFLTTGSQSVVRDADQVGTFSQELRYASPKWTAGDFIAGVYLLDEDGSRQLGTQGLAARTGALVSSIQARQHVKTTSYALFVDGTAHLGPQVDLAAGARYTYDRKNASLLRTDAIVAANTFAVGGLQDSWNEWTPRVALNWRPARSAMLYASVTRGFTAGGYNTEASSARAFASPFAPESVTSYETGLKSQWLDDSLRLNASVFKMKYRDKQELVNNTATGILNIFNASRATTKGAEIEVVYRPLRWFGLSLNYAYLDAVYDEFVIGNVNNTGNPLGSSPRNTYSAAVDVNRSFWFGTLFAMASYSRTGAYYTGATKDPNLLIPGYGLTNASVGYETTDRRYRFTAWIRNAADTSYILTRSTQVVRSEYLGEPRTFGVSLLARF